MEYKTRMRRVWIAEGWNVARVSFAPIRLKMEPLSSVQRNAPAEMEKVTAIDWKIVTPGFLALATSDQITECLRTMMCVLTIIVTMGLRILEKMTLIVEVQIA
jgi:hypothetical protein